MKTWLRKFLAVLCTICMMVTNLPIAAIAETLDDARAIETDVDGAKSDPAPQPEVLMWKTRRPRPGPSAWWAMTAACTIPSTRMPAFTC